MRTSTNLNVQLHSKNNYWLRFEQEIRGKLDYFFKSLKYCSHLSKHCG